MKIEVEGEDKVRHTEELRDFNEFFDLSGDAEWQIYKKEELPEQVIALLEAV